MNMVNAQDNEGCSVYDDKRKFRDLLFDYYILKTTNFYYDTQRSNQRTS